MDQEHHAVEVAPSDGTHARREFPTGWVVAFSGVFVLGFAVIVVVLMSRRRENRS